MIKNKNTYKLNNYNDIYYFAYGSNMDINRLYKRIKRCVNGSNAILLNYKLIFNKKTSSNDYAYANIEFSTGNKVYGKLYKLTVNEMKLIDKDEGPGYDRKLFDIIDLNNNHIKAYAYIATDTKYLTKELKPSDDYLKYFI
jgi:gamma-glutamylcyclotransferase